MLDDGACQPPPRPAAVVESVEVVVEVADELACALTADTAALEEHSSRPQPADLSAPH